VARFDKYDGVSGGFRAPLAADFVTAANMSKAFGVGLDTNGRVVLAIGTTGIKGVLILTKKKYAGEIVDVMTAGEVAEFDPVTPGTLAAAGTNWQALTTDGTISAAAADATHINIGYTVQAGRLVVGKHV
jgi:hypothetical protein